MAGKHILGSTHERAYAGCIITFVHEDGRELVRHYGGYSYQTTTNYRPTQNTYGIDPILRNVCAQLDLCPGWKIRTISNPQTIYQDIKGRATQGLGQAVPKPEVQILGRLGLRHHLHND